MKLADRYRIRPGRKVSLAAYDPDETRAYKDREAAAEQLQKNIARLSDLQYLLYAESKRSVLIIFQAMDAGGKDGAIRHVMSGLNPQGCRVTSFKSPSLEELSHDFLWRIHKAMPAKGEFGIFNRSQYEDVLIARVHELVPESVWSLRYKMINQFEKMLSDNGVTILKFYLHISRAEQKKRLLARINDPKKQWKIAPADVAERKHWKEYVRAYEVAMTRCSTGHAPWYIIPANRKWYRNLAISQILVDTLEGMNLKLPKPTCDITKIVIR